MWKFILREVLILLAVFIGGFLLIVYFTAWGMEPGPAPATIQMSIVYGDSTVIPVEVSAVVPDTVAPREIIFRAWKNGTVTSAHYIPDSSGVIVARIVRNGAK